MAELAGGRSRIRLAVTLGDPRGIGPEVAAAAARAVRADASSPELVFVGAADTGAEPDADSFVEVGTWAGGSPAEAGRLAALAVEHGARLALDGAVDGIVTAPIDKAALLAAGWPDPGHTELLGRLTGVREPVMMMCAERTALGAFPLRVVLATTHLALRAVPAALTIDRLIQQTVAAEDGLRSGFGIASPRLALCALNPHASDGGRFGDEESILYEPALARLRTLGVDAAGPIPADTVFVRALRGEFDAVIAPYHDVGMAAFKTASFGQGVNVTMGLPFVRTSPDHGTALDIAGRGVADASSMIEAIRMAERLALRRRDALLRA